MNREKILEMIRPYVKENRLTYENFDEIFCMLSQKEKYSVVDFLNEELKIFLADEEDFETTKENFQLVDYVLAAVKSYVEHQQLTYDEFDEIFSKLDKRKQYEIIEVLYSSNVLLVDEKIFPEQTELQHQKNFPPQPQNIIPRKSHEIKTSNSVLVRLAQNGDMQALRDLLVKNRLLVLKYAKRYEKIFKHSLSIEDMEQAGMVGMLKAVERFDLSRSTQFTTYAVWWINQSILRTIYNAGFSIRLPVHMFEKISKARRLDSELYFQGKNDSSERVELISKKMGISVDEVHELFLLSRTYISLTSLDAPIDEEGDSALRDVLEDFNSPTPFDVVEKKILGEIIANAMSTLNGREKQVLLFRFGFYDGKEYTLEDIGRIFGLTRERIRQIEKKALGKLRHPSHSKKLKEFIQ